MNDWTDCPSSTGFSLCLFFLCRPTEELLKLVLSREIGPPADVFVVSALQYWIREHEDLLCRLIAALLSNRCTPASSPTKRKRGGGSAGGAGRGAAAGPPSAEQVLSHLDHLRQSCRQNGCHLYNSDVVQRALLQAQAQCSDAQRKRFSDLFALAEVEELEPKPGRRGGRKGKGAPKGRTPATTRGVSDSSEESSEVCLLFIYFSSLVVLVLNSTENFIFIPK